MLSGSQWGHHRHDSRSVTRRAAKCDRHGDGRRDRLFPNPSSPTKAASIALHRCRPADRNYAPGFRTLPREVVVAAEEVTTAALQLQVRDRSEIVTVEAAIPQLDLDRHAVEQVVNRHRFKSSRLMAGASYSSRITADVARINDPVDAGTQQNFSQEIVQEFRVSSVNFDLSTGITAGGAINVLTRTRPTRFGPYCPAFTDPTADRPYSDPPSGRE